MPGILYIVSTPIGNLEDITLRAIRTLSEVATIAAEDTRHTRKLLSHLKINTPLTSYHDFNKEEKTPVIISRLQDGDSFALVSDAGTPTLSDPGFYLIRSAISNDIAVTPIPGVTAAISALSISGLPTDRFSFEGFLPRKKGKRDKRLEDLRSDPRTLIFYESTYRLNKLLEALLSIFGERQVAISRELTKKFEEVIRGDITSVLEKIKGRRLKGEITVVVEGMPDIPVKPSRKYGTSK